MCVRIIISTNLRSIIFIFIFSNHMISFCAHVYVVMYVCDYASICLFVFFYKLY